jgi:hypothetical protein
MKDKFLLILLLMSAGLALTTGFTRNGAKMQSPSPQVNIKDLSERGLSIIGPSDPAFNQILASQSQLQKNPVVADLSPFSTLIKNTGPRSVIAFTLKWELMKADGTVRVKTIDYIELWRLMGIKSSEKSSYTIKSNSAWFASPSVEVNQDINFEGASASTSLTPDEAAMLQRVRAELSQYTNITVTLDGAFLDDGQFVGQDSTGFFDKVVAQRNAKRDLIIQVKQDLQQGQSKQQIFQRLEGAANEPEAKSNTSSAMISDYHKHKKEIVAEMLRTRASVGDDRAIELFLQQMREPMPELRKN